MDSQTTLINPQRFTSLIFANHSVKDTLISCSTDLQTPLFMINTDKGDHKTEIHDARTQRLVATLRRREFFPDLIVRGDEETRVSKWLRKEKSPNGCTVHAFTASTGTNYYWKSDREHRQALYHENDHEQPIVTYDPQRGTPLALRLLGEANNILESVIVSFMILEIDMRMKEKDIPSQFVI